MTQTNHTLDAAIEALALCQRRGVDPNYSYEGVAALKAIAALTEIDAVYDAATELEAELDDEQDRQQLIDVYLADAEMATAEIAFHARKAAA